MQKNDVRFLIFFVLFCAAVFGCFLYISSLVLPDREYYQAQISAAYYRGCRDGYSEGEHAGYSVGYRDGYEEGYYSGIDHIPLEEFPEAWP